MSRFYGSMSGSRGEVTRCGTPSSGINAHLRGWTVGVRVDGTPLTGDRGGQPDVDAFRIYATAGSNGEGSDVLLGTVYRANGGDVTFEPAD